MMNQASTEKADSGKWKTFCKRTLSSVLLLGILGGVLLWGNVWGFRGLVCLFCILTAWEWTHMFNISGKPGQPWLSFWFSSLYPIALSLCCGFLPNKDILTALLLIPIPIVLLAVMSFTWEMRRPIVGSRSLRSVGNTLVSFIFPVWMLSFAIPMMELGSVRELTIWLSYGATLLLWTVLFTKLTDIFAYVSGVIAGGRIFKDRKLIPHISPKKTWEGLIGSYILSLSAGWSLGVALGVFNHSPLLVFVFLTMLFVLAVSGDLAGSLIKRSLSVKDSGSLLPGIGGFFDLIDSLAFTIPVVFYVVFLMQILGGGIPFA